MESPPSPPPEPPEPAQGPPPPEIQHWGPYERAIPLHWYPPNVVAQPVSWGLYQPVEGGPAAGTEAPARPPAQRGPQPAQEPGISFRPYQRPQPRGPTPDQEAPTNSGPVQPGLQPPINWTIFRVQRGRSPCQERSENAGLVRPVPRGPGAAQEPAPPAFHPYQREERGSGVPIRWTLYQHRTILGTESRVRPGHNRTSYRPLPDPEARDQEAGTCWVPYQQTGEPPQTEILYPRGPVEVIQESHISGILYQRPFTVRLDPPIRGMLYQRGPTVATEAPLSGILIQRIPGQEAGPTVRAASPGQEPPQKCVRFDASTGPGSSGGGARQELAPGPGPSRKVAGPGPSRGAAKNRAPAGPGPSRKEAARAGPSRGAAQNGAAAGAGNNCGPQERAAQRPTGRACVFGPEPPLNWNSPVGPATPVSPFESCSHGIWLPNLFYLAPGALPRGAFPLHVPGEEPGALPERIPPEIVRGLAVRSVFEADWDWNNDPNYSDGEVEEGMEEEEETDSEDYSDGMESPDPEALEQCNNGPGPSG